MDFNIILRMKNLIDIHTGEMNDSEDTLGEMSILTVTHGTSLTLLDCDTRTARNEPGAVLPSKHLIA